MAIPLCRDCASSISGVRHYSSVRATDVRPGVDIVYHGNSQDLEYDLILHPGPDPQTLRLRFEGDSAPNLDSSGDLVFKTTSAELRQHAPRVGYSAVH
jgi:hypothetical protein